MLKRYKFKNKEEFTSLLNDMTTHHKFINVSIILSNAKYNEEGVKTKEVVFSELYHVDIYKEDYEDFSVFNDYEVFPKNPRHKIS